MSARSGAVVVSRSRSKGLQFAGASLILCVGGFWQARTGTHFLGLPVSVVRGIGWAGVVLFGLGAVVLTRQAFQTGPVFSMDSLGLDDSRTRGGIGHVAWTDVADVRLSNVGRAEVLVLEPKDPQAYLAGPGKSRESVLVVNQRRAGHMLLVPVDRLSLSPQEILAAAQTLRSGQGIS